MNRETCSWCWRCSAGQQMPPHQSAQHCSRPVVGAGQQMPHHKPKQQCSRPVVGAGAALQPAWPPGGLVGPLPCHMPAPSAEPQSPSSAHSHCPPAPAVHSQPCSANVDNHNNNNDNNTRKILVMITIYRCASRC